MARHAWAVDRLWEGMIGGGDHRWELGVAALGDTPLPFSPRSDAPILAARLQRLAKRAHAMRMGETLDDRMRTYGEILVTCAACHDRVRAVRAR